MVNKKAYLKTLEAVMAIAIFLIFLVTALVVNQPWENDSTIPDDIKLIQDTVLNKIETDESIRSCLVNNWENSEEALDICLEQQYVGIDALIPDTLHYAHDLCGEPTCPIDENIFFDEDENYDKKTIYADSLIIQHPKDDGNSQIVVYRLFLWRIIE